MAQIITGYEVLEGYPATFRAYVEIDDEAPVLQSDIASINYTVTDLTTNTAVTGHDTEPLVVADVIYDTLQTPWSKTGGYNLKFTLPSDAFPEARPYRVKVNIIPTSSEKIPAIWIVSSAETGE
jgi:hypothetical protein